MKDKIINHLISAGYSKSFAENLVLSFELELRKEFKAEIERLKADVIGNLITEPERDGDGC